MAHDKLLKEKRGAVMDLAARHGAKNIRVFGSVARGQADAESDIDLLVKMCLGGRPCIYAFLAASRLSSEASAIPRLAEPL